jgi:aminopeptidase N
MEFSTDGLFFEGEGGLCILKGEFRPDPFPDWPEFDYFHRFPIKKMIRFKFAISLLLLLISSRIFASGIDSLDVIQYDISIDSAINRPTLKRLHAHTNVRFVPKVNGLLIADLDLLLFQVDSVKVNGQLTTFNYNDTILSVGLIQPRALSDTVDCEVWYQGAGVRDPSFGGVYYQGSYVYNLGVGLQTIPHVMGKAWFPCIDDFTERAKYRFHLRTSAGLMGVANGELYQTDTHPNGDKTWHWELDQTIPPYLASFNIAPYVLSTQRYISVFGDTIHFDIYAEAGDTTNGVLSTLNMFPGLLYFENHFGRFRWSRLGFTIVNLPLSGSIGAMEHATNVAFPRILLPQGLQYETVWMHEASHHWFGDLVTCEDAGEMWLNEGWASFCEAFFTQGIYGFNDYKNYNRNTHSNVLRRAHHEDGGYQPLSGMPEAYTYSRTTYSKGAMVVHSLRGQMGDAAFFQGVRQYLSEYEFRHANSDSLRISLEQSSGQNLQDFFDVWVKQAGFIHISLDSFIVTSGGPIYQTHVSLRQNLKGANVLATAVRVPLRLIGSNWQTLDTTVVMGGSTQTFSFPTSFETVGVLIDPEEWLADATTDNYKEITVPATYSFDQTWCDVLVNSVPDSILMQVTHHWVAPSNFFTPVPHVQLNNARYWTIAGKIPSSFQAGAKFYYNGTTSATAGLLDNSWLPLGTREDSIKLYYRKNAAHDWTLVPGIIHNIGSPNDRTGNIQISNLQQGDYAFALTEVYVGQEAAIQELDFKVYPNPNTGLFELVLPNGQGKFQITLYDAEGRQHLNMTVENQETIAVEKAYLSNGWYLLSIVDEFGRSGSQRVMIER